jgi:uncharacterized protein YkwD
MRNWMMILTAAAVLAEASASFAGPSSAQDKQTRPAAPTPTPAAASAKSSAAAKAVPARPSAAARLAPSKEEQAIFQSVNRERASRHLPPLKWSAALAAAARLHAQKMAREGALSHQFPGEADMGMRIRVAGVRFSSAAENVALGPTAGVIHQQWMHSPAHRDNILDPGLDSLGVAVVERQGQLFAVQDFALVAR